ncbi:hypothetical protein [Streptomyces bungoensis]|uniref:hypothetical protein n=1 Tax=Streptomyces bungoensis TaxID=285568 RepID=UPI00341EAEC9
MKVSRYWKAVVAGVVAGGSAAVPALQDSTLTAAEIVAIVVAVLSGSGLTWLTPNRKPSAGDGSSEPPRTT